MGLYRKKPVVIEARRWDGHECGAQKIISWAISKGGNISYAILRAPSGTPDERPATAALAIETLEGTMFASPGDYVIRGVQGEFYPCKPDIFDQTYEEAE